MKHIKKIGIILMASLIIVSGILSAVPVNAAETVDEDCYVISSEDIDKNGTVSQTVTDSNGNETTVEIQEVPGYARSSGRKWKVSFTSVVVNCYFYMNVSGNKCTSAYDKKISTITCTYSNDKLKRTSTYAKLSMDITGYMNLMKFNGWLKGTVTGKKNNIKVSYNF